MPHLLTASLMLIGLGGVVAGVSGLTLPPGDRLSALLALAVGGGTGLAVFAIGIFVVDATHDTDTAYQLAFFLASLGGLGAVIACAVIARRRAQPDAAAPPA
jgi:hypothetical protein